MRAALSEALAAGVDASRAVALVAQAEPSATTADLRIVAERAEADLLRLVDVVSRLKQWGSRTSHPRGQAARLFEACR